MSDLRQSKEYANYLKSIGWTCLPAGRKPKKVYIYLKKLPFLGWFAKIQRPSSLNDETISFIERKYSPFQIAIEPLNQKQISILKKFKLSNNPSLPTKTLIIDLKKSEREILDNFSAKTRYNLRNV